MSDTLSEVIVFRVSKPVYDALVEFQTHMGHKKLGTTVRRVLDIGLDMINTWQDDPIKQDTECEPQS